MRNPTAFLKTEYDDLVAKNIDWRVRTLETASKPRAKVNGKAVIMLNTNNYLGLSTHPKMIQANIDATKEWGVGAGAVAVIAGTMTLHRTFEERLAKFKKVEAALTYPTGFAVNEGLIPQLAGEGDLIISDELNHGSIIDGVRLTKANRAVYKHNDLGDLERVLTESEKTTPAPRRILIITDGVFSMDGDIAPLPGICKLAESHGAMVYVDDCHGEGVLGQGRGIVSHFKLQGKVHVEGGCMSKGFGVIGGSAAGSRDLYNFAYNKSRSWLLSTALPPGTVAACTAALDVIETEPQHVRKLWDNTAYFKKAVDQLGFNTGKSETPIIPLITGDPEKAQRMSAMLFDEGVFATPIVFPMVAREKSRIRCQINAKMTKADLDDALRAIEKCGKAVGAI